MASRGRKEFTIQEEVNFRCFNDFNYEELDLNDSSTTFTASCTTNTNTTVDVGSGNSNIKVGMHVTGTDIPTSTVITAVNAETVTQFTISNAATGSATITVTFAGGSDSEAASNITSANPAKKVVIYEKPGSATSLLQDTDKLTVTYNSKTLTIDSSDLPFTLTGELITSLSVSVDQANLTDAVSVLSFH